jgi:hypothetical protein
VASPLLYFDRGIAGGGSRVKAFAAARRRTVVALVALTAAAVALAGTALAGGSGPGERSDRAPAKMQRGDGKAGDYRAGQGGKRHDGHCPFGGERRQAPSDRV